MDLNHYVFFFIVIVCIIVFNPYKVPTQNNIWMYWENKPNKNKPDYLKLCYDTVVKHCSKDATIFLLNEYTVHYYLPFIRKDIMNLTSIPHKTDYIRLQLLYHYGGVWLDSDTIVFKSFKPYFKLLKNYDYVGFGCNSDECKVTGIGYNKSSNWAMGAKKHSLLMKRCIQGADVILNNPSQLKTNYHLVGRELLWKEINYLLKNNSKWSFYHVNSICVQLNEHGKKNNNALLIKNGIIDDACLHKRVFLPFYNTAPGFPSWFIKMNKQELLQSNTLFGKYMNYTLNTFS
jgi:hypothetical protein